MAELGEGPAPKSEGGNGQRQYSGNSGLFDRQQGAPRAITAGPGNMGGGGGPRQGGPPSRGPGGSSNPQMQNQWGPPNVNIYFISSLT